jgi:hypothetical protein
MSELTLDDTVAALLSSLEGEVVLRDKRGKELGRFTPGRATDELSEADVRKLFDPEEMKRRKLAEMGKGISTSELLARLHALKENGK